MLHFSAPTVEYGSHVTLHYRLSLLDGMDIINTFSHRPATLLLGTGQIAPSLEKILIGRKAGDHSTIQLTPEQGFGVRQSERIYRVSRATLDAQGIDAHTCAPGDMIEFSAPHGERYAGMLKAFEEDGAVFDFNHPLAGQTLVFEIQIIAVL